MKRPYVRLNMASSVDGKITSSRREKLTLGSPEDRATMEDLRVKADGVLIGGGTLRDEDPVLAVADARKIVQRRAVKGNDQPINVVVSSSLNFPIEGSRFFTSTHTTKVVCTTESADPRKLKQLRAHARVLTLTAAESGRVDVEEMLAEMLGMGIEQLLLEGGGELNFEMLKAGLIDEVFLTLFPAIIGGAMTPTTFEGVGFAGDEVRGLTLRSIRHNEYGEIFLNYTVNDPHR